MQKAATSAEPFVPEARTLPVLRKAVQTVPRAAISTATQPRRSSAR